MSDTFTPVGELLVNELNTLKSLESLKNRTYMEMGMLVAQLFDKYVVLQNTQDALHGTVQEIKNRCSIPDNVEVHITSDGKVHVKQV